VVSPVFVPQRLNRLVHLRSWFGGGGVTRMGRDPPRFAEGEPHTARRRGSVARLLGRAIGPDRGR
jgi:hypothetical protein